MFGCTLEDSMERDKFMSPDSAKEFGIIDMVLNHPPKHGQNENSDVPLSVNQ